MARGALLFLVVSLLAICQAQFTMESFEGSPTFSDFKLIHMMQHGTLENFNLFRETEVEGEASIFSGIRSFRRIREVFSPEKGFLRKESMQVPDPADKTTVLNLADMSYNAYENRNTSTNWRAVPGYNVSTEFGWYSNGLQGYVFGNSDRSILVMSIKGTTFKFFGEGGTSENDRFMDNLMFSCCCAVAEQANDPVCGCATSGNTCNQTCIEKRASASDTYFYVAQDFYLRLKQLFPSSDIWFTGHSLGGALAGLLAAKNNLPAFAYEAPGELLYAQRLGLKIDTGNMQKYHIFHYGNDADPIFLGTCTGRFSTCQQFGYIMETQCHIGSTCVYDGGLVTQINNHRLEVCINRFFIPQPVPFCVPQNNCIECPSWKFS